MRLFAVLHACRAAGGLVVARNLIRSLLKTAPDKWEIGLALPTEAGYEEVLGHRPSHITWYDSSSSVPARLWFDNVILTRAITQFMEPSDMPV